MTVKKTMEQKLTLTLALSFGFFATLALGQDSCIEGKNTLGTCECDGQLFIGTNCLEGFFCTSKVSDASLYNGCVAKCKTSEEILVVDIPNKSWKCVNTTQTNFKCPGSFNLECKDVGNFTGKDCECDSQLWMSGDCKEAFFCMSRMGGGGKSYKCEDPEEIVEVDLPEYKLACSKNSGYCPGLGGFKVGCKEYLQSSTESPSESSTARLTASFAVICSVAVVLAKNIH